jgi:hypothetical protein
MTAQVMRRCCYNPHQQAAAQREVGVGVGSLARIRTLASWAATEEFEAMRLDLEARTSSGLGGHGRSIYCFVATHYYS